MAKVKSAPASSTALQAKFIGARDALNAVMLEREDEVQMLMTGLLIREHVLLIGPPGTGKSHLLNSLMSWLSGKVFSYLMTRFSTQDEVFGQYSLSALKRDEFKRVTKNKLSEADAGYIDEVFKGSPAILNSLLTVMNEGTYDDGTGPQPIPLRILVASSNEYPRDDDGLNAMLDRFLLRKNVGYITKAANRHKLLFGGNHQPNFNGNRLTMAELDQAISEVAGVPFSDDAKEIMEKIVDKLRAAGIVPSDRRLVKSLKALQASAWLGYPARLAEDATAKLEVTADDFEMLAHTLWVDPNTQPQKTAAIVAAVSNPMLFEVNSLMMEAEQIITTIDTRDLSKLAKQTTELKKLQEILDRLKAMKAHPRVTQAIDHVTGSLKQIRMAMANV